MHQCVKGFVRGLLLGLAAGVGFAVVSGGILKKDRGFRRRTEQTEREARELIANLRELFR